MTTAAVAALALGYPAATQDLLGLMLVAVGLESIFAFCIGGKTFGRLMRLGVLPAETCEACTTVSLARCRTPQSTLV